MRATVAQDAAAAIGFVALTLYRIEYLKLI